ncbi:MAG: flagella basal body P-ring formation protein FlgA [Oligoflexia bacterium]|nr:flagella basal body P-ring formation protein FlgA [Oligoflexia bacterium]MBF0366109.1 flagella basal body P-ring formation protein FlgA [Oligoflexia bacterium]
MKKSVGLLKFVLAMVLLVYSLSGSGGRAEERCEITFPGRIYVPTNLSEKDFNEIVSVSSEDACPKGILKEIFVILKNVQGPLREDYLSEVLQTQVVLKRQAGVTPAWTKIEELLRNEWDCSSNVAITDVKLLLPRQYLLLSEEEDVVVDRDGTLCDEMKLGEKNFKLYVSNKQKQKQKTVLLNARIAKKIYILKTKRSISRFSTENLSELVEVDYLYTENPEHFFQDKSLLKYFKLNKNVPQGHVLKNIDVSAEMQVKIGQVVKVIFADARVKLTTTAICRKSGRVGEMVEVMNPKSKKMFIAKVTDYDSVTLEP